MGKLGYSSITLTDLTEMLPVSLVLESSLPQNIQTKIGNLYTPDLSKDGEELIITPSLFIGTEEVKTIPVKKSEEQDSNYIYYQTGDIGENGAEINYVDSSTQKDGIWVDDEGKLHYNKNLNRNITIEARINNFKNEKHNSTIELVKTTNPINILFLEEGNNNYNVVINSGGREHFEEENASPITLTAELYHGTTPITEGITYKWDIVTDTDTEDEEDNTDWDEDKDGTDFISTKPNIIVERSKVSSVEVFSCTITVNKTGLSYTGTKILRDFTDGYTNQLIADKSLILTPNNTTVTLTNQVWYQANIINKDKYEGNNLTEEQIKENESNHNRFFYKWSLLTKDAEEIILFLGSGKEYKDYTIDLNSSFQKLDETGKVLVDDETGSPIEGNFPKENFSILGMVTIDGKTVTLNYADIKYQPVTYTVNVSPKTVFVPATNSGAYRGEDDFIQKIKFQLLDDNKQPLAYDVNNSDQPSLINNNDNSSIKITKKDSSIWDFDIEFILDTKSSNSLWGDVNSKTYEFTYEYLGNIFTEEFEVIKNYSGEQGFSGYTIDLSNNFHAFPGGESIADPGEIAETDISAFYGDQNLEILEVKVNNNGDIIYSSDGENTPVPETNVKNLLISARLVTENNAIRITMKTGERGSSAITEGNTLTFTIKVKHPEKNETLNIVKTFTYIINYEGKSYYLSTDYNNIMYSEANGTYEPSLSQGINVYSLYRGEKGEALTYENGKIIYSLNEGETWTPLGSSGKIINYSGAKNIQIRLYGSASTVDNVPIDLEKNKKYLYDMETIPILTSLEGYEIGGENLLKNTKKMTISESLWSKSNNVEINEDESFAIAMFSNEEANYLFSPLSDFDKDFINEQFCLSFLSQSFNWDSFGDENSYFIIQIKLYDENKEEKMYKEIAFISKNNNFNLSTKEDYLILPKQNWVSFYKVFSFKDFNFSENDPDIKIENMKFFSCNFYTRQIESLIDEEEKDKLQIKKIKIEKGNIPTEWTSNSEDSNLIIEDIQSQLASDSARIDSINQSLVNLTDNQLTFGQSENIKFSIITGINEDKTLLTEETENFKPIEIMGANGQSYSFLSVQDFKKYIDDLNSSNAKSFADYSTVLINSNLEEYKNSIKILPATKDNPQGFISIQTSFWDTNSGKEYSEALKLTSNKLSFIENKNEVAYLSQNKLYIKNAQITESLIFGKDEITGDEDSHLKVIVSDNGVGFIWEVLNNG